MIGFSPVLLFTDILVFTLIGVLIAFVRYISKNKLLKEKWSGVFKRPSHIIALIILVFYGLIGALDSIHFQVALEEQPDEIIDYETNVRSVLDLILNQLPHINEKTYSAPFATKQFVAEKVVENGKVTWNHPRLVYGGSHLKDGDNVLVDILIKSGIGLGIGIGVLLLFYLFFKFVKSKRQIKLFKNYKLVFATVGIIILTSAVILVLSNYYHILGTDKVGRDVFYAGIKSIRTGLVIGTVATLVMLPFAIILGTFSGFFRGVVDDIIQYIYTTLSSIPSVLLIAAAVLTMQVVMGKFSESFSLNIYRADLRLLVLCVILGITSWTGLCRLLRGETLKVRELDFVNASRALGVSNINIIYKHIIPNVFHVVIIAVVLDFSGLVLAEAVLSYVGVGVDPSSFSWGNMINAARLEMAREPVVWWSLTGAFIMMFTLVLAANIFADGIRDVFDPKSKDILT